MSVYCSAERTSDLLSDSLLRKKEKKTSLVDGILEIFCSYGGTMTCTSNSVL